MATRLGKELSNLESDKRVRVSPDGDDVFKWIVKMYGPDGSPYENGTFIIEIAFPPDYPVGKPDITFETRIFHPYVNSTGKACLEILHDWTPASTVSKLIDEIYGILESPAAPETPFNTEAASLLASDPEEFRATAAAWTAEHAT